MSSERTLLIVKPDGVQRALIGEIITRFEKHGNKLVAMKFMKADEELLTKHYIDLKDKPFFGTLVSYMGSGPVVPMVWEGKGVVVSSRRMLGETNPVDSKPGTIRGDYCIDISRNLVHGSDSIESAKKEILLWFSAKELCDWEPNQKPHIYE